MPTDGLSASKMTKRERDCCKHRFDFEPSALSSVVNFVIPFPRTF